MNKRMIVLIALVAVVLAMPASAETIEVRSNVADAACAAAGLTWDAHNFGAFWYDLDDDLSTECLVLEAGKVSDWDRTIDEECLGYTTCPLYQEYELYACKGLTVDGSEGYYLEGWMGLPYVAIGGRADKLCEPLVEFEGDDKKTLSTGEPWDLGGGFALIAENLTCLCGTTALCDSCTLSFSKNGVKLDEQIIYVNTSDGQDRVYTYAPDIGGEEHVPVFSCYVDAVFNGTDSDLVQLMYVFLIDDEVMEINTGETYGIMEVVTASSSHVILRNEYDIDLDPDTTEHIMGDLYFKTADDDDRIRFYLFVEYTEPGTYEVRGDVINVSENTPDVWNDGVTWDATTFAAFWYDLDDDLSTETLTLEKETIGGATDNTIYEGKLIYRTEPVWQEYELYDNEGLVVEGDTDALSEGYYIEGWMAEKYVAVNDNADKLVKLLVEFEDNEMHVLYSDAAWDLGGGFAFELLGIDDTGDKASLQLSKDDAPLYMTCIDTGTGTRQDRVYTYTADIGGENDVPVFSCYVDTVFKGGDISYVQLKYAFLIDNEVLEIETSETYGAMDVVTANMNEIILKNEDNTLDLSRDTTEHIMGNMYFKTADDADHIRFYPFVERTISGEEPTPPADTIPAIDTDNDGVPDVWDLDNSTPAGYWTDADGRGRMWGDMNDDGELTSVDALMIVQAVVGKIDL